MRFPVGNVLRRSPDRSAAPAKVLAGMFVCFVGGPKIRERKGGSMGHLFFISISEHVLS